MGHEDGRLLVELRFGHELGKLEAEEEVRAEGDDAGQLGLDSETAEQAHGATLAEAADDNAVGRDARVDFLLDQVVEIRLARQDSSLVFITAESLGGTIDSELIHLLCQSYLNVGRKGRQERVSLQCHTNQASSCPSWQ